MAYKTQTGVLPAYSTHPRAKELHRISRFLDFIPSITDMVLQDLTHVCVPACPAGTAESAPPVVPKSRRAAPLIVSIPGQTLPPD